MDTLAYLALLERTRLLWQWLDELKLSQARRERLRPMRPTFGPSTPGGNASELDIELSLELRKTVLQAQVLTGRRPEGTGAMAGLQYLALCADVLPSHPQACLVTDRLHRIHSELLLFIQPGDAPQPTNP